MLTITIVIDKFFFFLKCFVAQSFSPHCLLKYIFDIASCSHLIKKKVQARHDIGIIVFDMLNSHSSLIATVWVDVMP